jgi:hypothetical protein
MRLSRPTRAAALALALALSASMLQARQASPLRVVAIGDIHGAVDSFTAILGAAGLIDAQRRWSGGSAVLVQTGDYLDRGAAVRDVMDLLMRLEGEAKRAGGRAEVLLGNHEAMNLLHEFRDVSPEALATFADSKSEDRRARAYDEYVSVAKRADPTAASVQSREAWMQTHPPGLIEYVDALGPRGSYGKWLRARKLAVVIDDTLYMHAGIGPEVTGSVDDVNRTASSEIAALDEAREALERANLARPFFTLQETVDAAVRELERIGAAIKAETPLGDHVTRDFVEKLQALANIGTSSLVAPEGPLWFRGLARWPDQDEPKVIALLDRIGVKRAVSAHTPIAAARIAPRFGDRVFLIDTGMLSSVYKGRPSALELQGGQATAIYEGGREPLGAALVKRP